MNSDFYYFYYLFYCCEGEKGKFSMSPASGGAAEKAGVRKGDRLIWLDGATVSELSHSAISKMVGPGLGHRNGSFSPLYINISVLW